MFVTVSTALCALSGDTLLPVPAQIGPHVSFIAAVIVWMLQPGPTFLWMVLTASSGKNSSSSIYIPIYSLVRSEYSKNCTRRHHGGGEQLYVPHFVTVGVEIVMATTQPSNSLRLQSTNTSKLGMSLMSNLFRPLHSSGLANARKHLLDFFLGAFLFEFYLYFRTLWNTCSWAKRSMGNTSAINRSTDSNTFWW